MPLTLVHPDGDDTGNALRVARGNHWLATSGPSAAIGCILSHSIGNWMQQVEGGSPRLEYRFVYWLVGPALVPNAAVRQRRMA